MDLVITTGIHHCWQFPNVFKQYRDKDLSEYNNFVFSYPNEAFVIMNRDQTLFEMIHEFLDHHGINPKRFTYETGNFRIAESYYRWCALNNIKQRPINLKVSNYWAEEFKCHEFTPTEGPRDYYYNYLNNMSHDYRVELYKMLIAEQLLDKAIYSFLKPNYAKDVPVVKFDTDGNDMNYMNSGNQEHIYNRSYFSLVPESVFSRPIHVHNELHPFEAWHREGHITEKTYKAIWYMNPFIIAGAPGSLQSLRDRGFKTFNGFLNESYDRQDNPEKRMFMIVQEVKRLSNMPFREIHKLYHSMTDILKYNQDRLRELSQK